MKITKQDVIDRGRDNLLFFGKSIAPAMFSVRSAGFHTEIGEHCLDKSIRFLNVQAPRGHAKSSLVAHLAVLHDLVYDEGDTFIVLVSKTEGHAVRLLQTIKDTLEFSQTFRALHGYWGRHTSLAWKSTSVELVDPRNPDRKISILVRGAAQQMRGLKYIHQRPTRVIYDDPEDEINTLTQESRERTLDGLLKGIMPGLDPHRGRCIVIGTPIHSQGLVNVLEGMSTWITLKYAALIPIEGADPRLPERERYYALWPEVMSVDRLLEGREAAESVGRVSSWYSEYMCQIVGDADQLFSRENMRFWQGFFKRDLNNNAYLEIEAISRGSRGLIKCEEVIRRPVCVFMGIDPASSTRRTADYSVIFVLAMDSDKRVYCLDYYRKRVKPLELADQIIKMYKKYRPDKTQIETVGYQEMLRNYLREKFDIRIPGLEIQNNPRNSKSNRLEGLQAQFAEGRVYMLPTMVDFEEELVLYPRGKNDDLLDGYYYARKGAYTPYHDVITNPSDVKKSDRVSYSSWMTV